MLALGKTAKGTLPLKTWTKDYKYHCGAPFFVLQVDAISGEKEPKAIRFYLSTMGPETPISPAYLKGNFATLSPIPEAAWSESLLKSLRLHIPKHDKIVDGHTSTGKPKWCSPPAPSSGWANHSTATGC